MTCEPTPRSAPENPGLSDLNGQWAVDVFGNFLPAHYRVFILFFGIVKWNSVSLVWLFVLPKRGKR